MGARNTQRWARRPLVSALLRVVIFCAPVIAGVLAGRAIAMLLPPPAGAAETVTWWLLVMGIASGVLWMVDTVARRFLPLAWLLRMTALFPTKAPRRWHVAVHIGTTRQLQQRLADARAAAVDDDSTAAATRILALVATLQAHDRRTRGHAERVRVYTDMLTAELGLDPDDRDRVRWAALLHDIGKLTVSEQVLNKPGKPSDAEWQALRGHPAEGALLCGPLLGWLGPWGDTIIQHHERYDGGGYPAGLAGEEICYGARIVAVPDAYEVMTAPRPYKDVMSARAAREELTEHAGRQFDPAIVRAFLNLSTRRLLWVAGPAAWLAQIPLLSRPARLDPATASLGVALALGLALSAGVAGRPFAVLEVETARNAVASAADDESEADDLDETVVLSAPDIVRIRRSPARPKPPREIEEDTPLVVILPPPPSPQPVPVPEPPAEPPPPSPDPQRPVAPDPSPIPTPEPTQPPPTEPEPTPAPLPVVAVADTAATVTNGSVTIAVLANDTGSLDGASISVASQPKHGSAAAAGTTVQFTAQPGWTGTVQFSYEVCTALGCSTAPVSVAVER